MNVRCAVGLKGLAVAPVSKHLSCIPTEICCSQRSESHSAMRTRMYSRTLGDFTTT